MPKVYVSRAPNLKQLGVDVAEKLEFVPASFRAIRHIRPTLACAFSDIIVQAQAPNRPVEQGIGGPSLLINVLVAKFANHLLLEAEIIGHPPDESRSVRQARARPLLENLEQSLHASVEKLSRKSDTSATII